MADDLSGEKVKIHFSPDNKEVIVEKGTNLLDAAIAGGVRLTASCGGLGVCGTCKVKVESGSVKTIRTKALSDEEMAQGIRQACQSKVLTDLTVSVLNESRLDKAIQARERKEFAGISATGWRFDPPLKKCHLVLPPPSLSDNISDLSRVMRGFRQSYNITDLSVSYEILPSLSEVLRAGQWQITVSTLREMTIPYSIASPAPRIIRVEPGNTLEKNYALAVDVGTTTVCTQLLDLNRGRIVARTLVFNKQIRFGADVIARIAFTQKPGTAGLKTLQEAVVESINETIDLVLKEAKIDRSEIGYLTIAGNTTMTQILLGLDPKYIRLSPYVPVAKFFPLLKAHLLGIRVPESVYMYSYPCISSYVGGDIVSGVIAAGVHQTKKLTFFMDIGTNGEIVVGNSDWMVTASCSAGPAFEGGGIKFGMVAMNGAIQDVSIDPESLDPEIRTIGDVKPKGICGSGLINTIAGLLEAGAIGQNGKFNTTTHSPRIRQGTEGYEYVLSWSDETQIGKDIVLTEADIDNLTRSKAAMYAGFHTLSRYVNVNLEDFEQVILAGNFGSSLNMEKAITIGLLPDIPREKFAFIGNSSLSGARLASYSSDIIEDAKRVAEMMTNVELSENTAFNDSYMAALFLPHTDAKAFPSVFEKLSRNKVRGQSA